MRQGSLKPLDWLVAELGLAFTLSWSHPGPILYWTWDVGLEGRLLLRPFRGWEWRPRPQGGSRDMVTSRSVGNCGREGGSRPPPRLMPTRVSCYC